MKPMRQKQEGVALILVVIAVIVILGAIGVIVERVHSSKRVTDAAIGRTALDEVCKAGIDIGIERLWQQYLIDEGGAAGNMTSYNDFLDDFVPNNEDLNGNGTQDGDETDLNGENGFEISAPVDLLEDSGPYELPSGGLVTQILISRTDDLTGTDLTIRATGLYNGQTKTAVQTSRVAGRLFRGFDYAVLANNINCILCHAQFLNGKLVRDQDAGAAWVDANNDGINDNSYARIKAAALESLMIRPSENDSITAGTLYTRGEVYDSTGAPMSAGDIESSTLDGFQLDTNANGNIVVDTDGSTTDVNLVNAESGGDGNLLPYANLYQNYPTDSGLMTDGDLPTSFPTPFPDANGDRTIDSSEFNSVMGSANGSITGGIIYGVNSGSTYPLGALPAANDPANAAATALSNDGAYDGNVILVGTDANPIVINGNVAIDGDLVISGKVQGRGILQVRRNTYIVGDVTYNDAADTFGEAPNGAENLLGVVSGGSILIGDYLTVRGKNHTADTSKYPDNTYSIDTRVANKTKTKKVGTTTQTLHLGYFDTGAVDAGFKATPTRPDPDGEGQQYSFTTSELMLFNNLEREKAAADPTYQPRYYGLRETQPNDIYWYNSSDEHSVRYDESGGTVTAFTSAELAGKTIQYMSPDGNWISESVLRQIWWNDEMSRTSYRPFQFDGVLYSSNAIFAITRSKKRHNSNTYGCMTINGGIVCADLGVLVPSNIEGGGPVPGLTMLYDDRVSDLLRVEDTNQVTFSRVVFLYEN